MLESNAISTHLQSGLRLSRSGSDGLQNPFVYRFMGCALQYAANTCLKFPLLLTKFSSPWLVLWSLIGLLSSVFFATLKVLFSLGAAFIMPLFTSLFPSRPFVGDWAADPDDRHSTFMGSIDFALVPTSSLGVVP